MQRARWGLVVAAIGVGVAVGSAVYVLRAPMYVAEAEYRASAPSPQGDSIVNNGAQPRDFAAQAREMAREYSEYKRVSDTMHKVITLCAVEGIAEALTRRALMSRSGDEDTHGKRLYHLYVKDHDDYDRLSSAAVGQDAPYSAAIGQALVKATWESEPVSLQEVDASTMMLRAYLKHESFPPPLEQYGNIARIDGQDYRATNPSDLFMMFKLDPSTPGTDEGWVYAVLSHDAEQVRAIGVIDSCVRCHSQTTRDRLYGPKSSWPMRDGRLVPPVRTLEPEAAYGPDEHGTP